MTRSIQAVAKEWLKRENAKWPRCATLVPDSDWKPKWNGPHPPSEVWRSCDYLVQVYEEKNGVLRMTVSRTDIQPDGGWMQDIPWSDLHELKAEIGRGEMYAVEVYPRDRDLVDVANMRHIWILPEPLNIGWFAEGQR